MPRKNEKVCETLSLSALYVRSSILDISSYRHVWLCISTFWSCFVLEQANKHSSNASKKSPPTRIWKHYCIVWSRYWLCDEKRGYVYIILAASHTSCSNHLLCVKVSIVNSTGVYKQTIVIADAASNFIKLQKHVGFLPGRQVGLYVRSVTHFLNLTSVKYTGWSATQWCHLICVISNEFVYSCVVARLVQVYRVRLKGVKRLEAPQDELRGVKRFLLLSQFQTKMKVRLCNIVLFVAGDGMWIHSTSCGEAAAEWSYAGEVLGYQDVSSNCIVMYGNGRVV